MKKGMTILIISALIIFSISFMSADNNSSTTAVSDKAYACLQSKIQDCSSLSTEQKTFSLLALGKCKDELLSDAQNNQCWPNTGCTIKATAQAILALKGNPLNKSATWLFGQRMTPPGMDWLLQIDPNGVGKCTVTYDSTSYAVSIDANKQMTSSNLGSCLKIYTGNYWLQILNSQSCFDNEYEVLCDTSFTTNLLYKDQATSTVYVLSGLHSSSAEGKTTEQVSSYCFKQGSLCDYEGTLWAALALQSLNYDINPYIPYLITKQSQNEQYLPEAFLYALLGDAYKNNLIVLQQQGQFWSVSGDKFYDTAVALLPFQQQDASEKTNSMNWLAEIQGADGCWQDNVRNTAFLLYSVWPKSTNPNGGVSGTDCEASNYFCSSLADCNSIGGAQLNNYTGCFSANICCSKQVPLKTCDQQGGTLCDSGLQCSVHATDSSDAISGKTCCISGSCQNTTQTTECDRNGGTCKSTCLTNEEQNTYGCDGSNVCCSQQQGGSYLWIIILAILIVLVLIGIIFRKKLMSFFSKLGKGKKQPRGPPPRGQPMQRGPMPMRRLPMPSQTRPVYRPVTPQRRPETDEVLKKLREMGK